MASKKEGTAEKVEVIKEDDEISITDSWIKYMEEQIEMREDIKSRLLFIQKWYKVSIFKGI